MAQYTLNKDLSVSATPPQQAVTDQKITVTSEADPTPISVVASGTVCEISNSSTTTKYYAKTTKGKTYLCESEWLDETEVRARCRLRVDNKTILNITIFNSYSLDYILRWGPDLEGHATTLSFD